MSRLSNKDFLQQLKQMYGTAKKNGTLWLTYKRVFEDDLKNKRCDKAQKNQKRAATCQEKSSFSVLVRAKTSQKKASTIVIPEEIAAFHRKLKDVQVQNTKQVLSNKKGIKRKEKEERKERKGDEEKKPNRAERRKAMKKERKRKRREEKAGMKREGGNFPRLQLQQSLQSRNLKAERSSAAAAVAATSSLLPFHSLLFFTLPDHEG